MAYCVYILYSAKADKYYVGQTEDLAYRLRVHNELGEDSFTALYRPWTLEWQLEVSSRSLAMRMEQYIKGRKSRAYLESLIRDESATDRLRKRFEPDEEVRPEE